jgi:fluoroquinolone resistance protein
VAELIEDESYRDEDWYGEHLTERAYARCTFSQVDLTESITQGCVFTECTFDNVSLNSSRHTDSAFLRCTFTNCNLFEAEFIGCKMVGSSFHATALRPLRVTGGDWSFAGLAGADLRGITVRDVRMREVDLTAAKCDNAVLAGVDLSGAQLHSASFMKSDLRGSDLTALDPTFVAVAGAIIEPAQAVVIAQVLGFEIR